MTNFCALELTGVKSVLNMINKLILKCFYSCDPVVLIRHLVLTSGLCLSMHAWL